MKNKYGWLYFYLHFITEIVCFYYLAKVMKWNDLYFILPFVYDAFAFVPQSILGYLSDKYKKISFSLIGIVLLIISVLLYIFKLPWFISVMTLTIGNALIHVNGAEVTLRSAKGKLSPAAIFVSGGSFGVITGKILASIDMNPYYLILLILTCIPFVLLSEYGRSESKEKDMNLFNYNNTNIDVRIVIILMVIVVMSRAYVGYGIPTSWNKTMFQTFLLFSFMGVGKALGGILSDRIGIRKVGIFSTLLAIPFLSFGDTNMYISLIGVTLFSMTMAITLGVLVSILKKYPGLAFGITTIALFLGTAPIFFIKVNGLVNNIIVLAVVSVLCSALLGLSIRKDNENV